MPDASVQPQEHLVRMRDGVMLAADVYLPHGWDSGPVLLTRTPYDKRASDLYYAHANRYAPHFVEAGYAVVIQDVRGKHRSSGQTMPFVHEAADGYDTLQWISEQPWSNGVVGMFGASYAGTTQWAAASSRHPALRALVPEQSTASVVSEGGYGATVTQRPPVGLHWISFLIENWTEQDDRTFQVDWTERPSMDVIDRIFRDLGHRAAGVDAYIPNAVPLDMFPSGHPFDRPALPTLHVIGWFDPWSHLGLQTYLDLRALPAWAPTQHLLADSMDHYSYHLDDSPVDESTDFLRSAEYWDRFRNRVIDPMVAFFDRYLTNRDLKIPGARWHVGRVGYLEAPSWPPITGEVATYHLDDFANAAKSFGRLVPQVPTKGGEATWSHDPANPLRGNENHFSPLAAHRDESKHVGGVLAFESDPLDTALELVGRATFFADIASTAKNADVFVRLLDVDLLGSARMIARGEATAVGVNEVPRQVDVQLSVNAYRFQIGHRLRLTVSGSDFPTYLPNAGTDENPWLAGPTAVAEHRLISATGSPARLEIPVVDLTA